MGGAPQAGFVEPDDVTAMRKVAKSLAGHSFSLEPVVIELIQAVLQLQFQNLFQQLEARSLLKE